MAAKTVAERFWPKVAKTSDDDELCWEWQGVIGRHGYGRFRVGTDPDRAKQLAHRVSYELSVDTIPPGMCVCHRCDNPRCVRPSHLFLGDHEANMRDKITKGRHVWPVRHGEENPAAKLTAAQVIDIRVRARRGNYSALAREYGVHHQTIRRIALGFGWGGSGLIYKVAEVGQ